MQDLKIFNTDLLPVFQKVYEENVSVLLSGSLALHLQKKPVRRKIKDIDIFLPFGDTLNVPNGFVLNKYIEEMDYEGEYFVRQVYDYGQVSIDVFSPADETIFKLDKSVCFEHSINMVWWVDIYKMKILHAFDNNFSKYKHRQDLIFAMLD